MKLTLTYAGAYNVALEDQIRDAVNGTSTHHYNSSPATPDGKLRHLNHIDVEIPDPIEADAVAAKLGAIAGIEVEAK